MLRLKGGETTSSARCRVRGVVLAVALWAVVVGCSGPGAEPDLACPSDAANYAGVSDLPLRDNVSDAFDMALARFGENPHLSHLAGEAGWQHSGLSGDQATWERTERGGRVAVATFANGPGGWTFSHVRFCDPA